jgi:uncharacterized protein
MKVSEDRRMEELSREECLELLAAHDLGRIAVSLDEGPPVIRPVNYLFDRVTQSVVMRTARGSKFHALLCASHASFEIDGIDQRSHTGWSVIIRGTTEEIVDRRDLRRLGERGLEPWAPGDKPHWIRIRAWTVSGRRILIPSAAIPEHYLG